MDKKLKIAIIGSRGYPYIYSGYETLVKELSERLIKKGHKVRVYCHSSLFKKKPRQVNGIELIYTPSIETKFLSQIVNSFFSFIHVCFSNVDVVFVVNSANGPFGILTRIARKKTCINVDGLEWLRPKWKGLGSYYFIIASKLSTILFDEIITDSFEMQNIYKDKFQANSTVIAYGSTMKKTTENSFLKKMDLETSNYYLLVGRLIPDNNSKFILSSFVKSNSNKKLVIVGDEPYGDLYSKRIKKVFDKRVVFTGYINNQNYLTQLYSNCFAYIHGHEFGGTNPTMINALTLGCNILALDTKFNREMLANKKSILFKKNITDLKILFNNLNSDDLLKKISDEKYNLPVIYSWTKIIDNYEILFKKLVKRIK